MYRALHFGLLIPAVIDPRVFGRTAFEQVAALNLRVRALAGRVGLGAFA